MSGIPPIPSEIIELDPRPLPRGGFPQPRTYASLTVDLLGVVRSCDYDLTRLMRCDISEVTGRPVSSILPGLPFSENITAYNISLAKIMFEPGQWYPLKLVCSGGFTEWVDASLERVEIHDRHFFFLQLRCPSSVPADGF